ncbi:MAG: hypothetical protein HKL81_09875 [Acidimicrobiaceae bacterium]|nr:hypothetical protein [Acidimicrobiaceae bacterium]NNN20337.1 hypothetical protein [Acidimicrobiaceae bacterium]
MSQRLLIHGGSAVLDTKAGAVQTDILVERGRISAIGNLLPKETPTEVLDATNCVILPGLIDAHVHGEWAVFDTALAEAALRQGITSFIVGQDGCSASSVSSRSMAYMSRYFPAIDGIALPVRLESLSDYLDLVDSEAYLNVGCLIPNGNLRYEAMGLSRSQATESELRKMGDKLLQGLDQGALGMSSGLDYVPSGFASIPELTALCRILKDRNRIYVSHIRGYGDKLADGISEFVDILVQSGVAGHISHLWGKAEEASILLKQAEANDCDISFDSYPYTKGSSLLAMVAVPVELQSQGPDVTIKALSEKKARQIVGQKASAAANLITISSVEDTGDARFVGMTLSQAAVASNREVGDLVCDLLIKSRLNVNTLIGRRNFTNEDMSWFLDDYRHMGCSDGIYYGDLPHPRGWGAFAASAEHYLRNPSNNWSCVAEHLSTRAAERFGLAGRGKLAVGAVADIAVFDPSLIKANSDYFNPRALASGAKYVLVSGEPLINDFIFNPKRAGRGIRR